MNDERDDDSKSSLLKSSKSLRRLLASAREVLNELEQIKFEEIHGRPPDDEDPPDYYDGSYSVIYSARMTSLKRRLEVILEALDLRKTLTLLNESWEKIDTKGIARLEYSPEVGEFECPSYELLNDIISSLEILSGASIKIEETELQKLGVRLHQIQYISTTLDKKIDREQDLQEIMDKYFRLTYPSYIRNITIHGLRNFKPDGGVPELKAAFEYKLINNKSEMDIAIRAIMEDTGGYKGSKDWNVFFPVYYMSEAFESEERIKADFRRRGIRNWHPVVVVDSTIKRGGVSAGGKAKAITGGSRPTAQMKRPIARAAKKAK